RVLAVRFLEFGKVLRREWTIFLCNARNVRTRIEYPDLLCWKTFLKKDHVCFYALAVWRERAARKSQDRVHVAILHQNFEHLTSLVFEETIIRQDDSSAPAGLERSQNVLKEIELFVAGLNCEVFALGRLVCSSCSKGRIGKDDVVLLSSKRIIDRVAEINVRLDSVQEKVHQRESARTRHQILTVVSLCLDAFRVSTIEDAFNIDIHGRPIFLVDHRDDPLEIYRIIKARRCLRENISQQSARFAQCSKNVCVMIG